jgi:hypothetical protein
MTGAHGAQLAGPDQEVIRRHAVDQHRQVGLGRAHVHHALEEDERQLVGGVATLRPQPAEVDVVADAARVGGESRRVLIETHQPAVHQLLGTLAADRSARQVALVEGVQVLVDPARRHAPDAGCLEPVEDVYEPHRLERLVEAARGLRGNPITDPGDLEQLGRPEGIGLGIGELARPGREATPDLRRRLEGDDRGLQELKLVRLIGVPAVDLGQSPHGVLLDAEKAVGEHLLVAEGGVADVRGMHAGLNTALHHRHVGKNARGLEPRPQPSMKLLRHVRAGESDAGAEPVAVTLPVGQDLFREDLFLLVGELL